MTPRPRRFPRTPIEPPLQTHRTSFAEQLAALAPFKRTTCDGVWSGIPRPGDRYGAAGWQFCTRHYGHDGPHRIQFYDGQERDWVDTRTYNREDYDL